MQAAQPISRHRQLAPWTAVDPARPTELLEDTEKHLRACQLAGELARLPGSGDLVYQPNWPPFQNGNNPAIAIGKFAAGRRLKLPATPWRPQNLNATTDEAFTFLDECIIQPSQTQDWIKPFRDFFLINDVACPRTLLQEAIDLTKDQINSMRNGGQNEVFQSIVILGLCPSGGDDFNSTTSTRNVNGSRKSRVGTTEELVRGIQREMNCLVKSLKLPWVVLCRDYKTDCNNEGACWIEEVDDADLLVQERVEGKMNAMLLKIDLALSTRLGAQVIGIVALDPSVARAAAGHPFPYPAPGPQNYFIDFPASQDRPRVWQVLHPARPFALARKDPLTEDNVGTYNSGSVYDRPLFGSVILVQSILLAFSQSFWTAFSTKFLPRFISEDRQPQSFLNPCDRVTKIEVDSFVAVARVIVKRSKTRMMESPFSAEPENLPVEMFLAGYSFYRLLNDRWSAGSTLMRNDGPRARVNGKLVMTVAPLGWGIEALLTDESTFPSLNPELEHALFVQDYQRDDMEVD